MSFSNLVSKAIDDCVNNKGHELYEPNAERLAKLAAMLDVCRGSGTISGGQARVDVNPLAGSVAIFFEDCYICFDSDSEVHPSELFAVADKFSVRGKEDKSGEMTLMFLIGGVFLIE